MHIEAKGGRKAPGRDENHTERAPKPPNIHRVAWKAPPGWIAPGWLRPEPGPATLPMGKFRFRWCLHVLGWSPMVLAERIHTHESSIRQMGRDKRPIADNLALWLEEGAARVLAGWREPDGWREKGDEWGHDEPEPPPRDMTDDEVVEALEL